MRRAMAAADTVRGTTAPNPWVGCVVVSGHDPDQVFAGATAPPGGPHAEIVALGRAGPAHARGATLVTTLEPCAHQGRTPPCTDAIIEAGVARVVIALEDPDPQVAGRGVTALRAAGIEVTVGTEAQDVGEQLAPYLKHRTTGQPWVVLKMAASLDARTAAPDGTSRWITGEAARQDVHRLRARSDAILVGAGTVRADDPELTVRLGDGPAPTQPLRVVLGAAPPGAKVLPALELSGPLDEVLTDLGRRGVLQLLVEGGASVAHDFHAAGLVDRYVFYLAPLLFGGDDGRPLFAGPGAGTIGDVWRGKLVSVERLGEDLRVEVAA
jgi:diaminohydroxyphosphoribosylaminopyrimidine deaminase / 5-amino-6-(5-phosphoribosylamino)uracil reductase